MRYVPRAILAGGLGLAAAFLVACGGGSSLLSSGQANSLLAAFDRVGQAAGSGNCASINNATSQLNSQIQNLPGSIQGNITDSLNQWASTVGGLATKACGSTKTTTTTSTHSTTSSTTSSTNSTTSTTSTTPPPTTSTIDHQLDCNNPDQHGYFYSVQRWCPARGWRHNYQRQRRRRRRRRTMTRTTDFE